MYISILIYPSCFFIISLKFDRDGILVVESFLDEKDVVGLREACDKLVYDMDPDVHRGVFSATTQAHAKVWVRLCNMELVKRIIQL